MESKQSVTNALRLLLRPIVRLLIELGLSYRDFNEIAKLVYVEVASENYGIKGRPTNMSRVAIMTGLTRREVSRLRRVIDHDPLVLKSANTVAGKILAIWHHEAKYLSASGEPKPLPLEGPGSLTELIDAIRGDIPSTAIIKELERVQAIAVRGQHARALSRYYMPKALHDASIERFGAVLHDVGQTITQNLFAQNGTGTIFEGRASNDNVSVHAQDAFKHYLERDAQTFLENVDDWLKDHEAEGGDGERVRLGIGIYAIANPVTQHHKR